MHLMDMSSCIEHWDSVEDLDEMDMMCELAGHGTIATGSVQSCKKL